jgi:hypothetical protein
MTTTTLPPVEFEHNPAKCPKTGPSYHRNGVAGWGFGVTILAAPGVTDDMVVAVAFSPEDDNEITVDDFHHAPRLPLIRHLAGLEPRPDGFRGSHYDGTTATIVFDDELLGAMVAIIDVDGFDDGKIAVFKVETLPDVRFMVNSWRGDTYMEAVAPWLAETIEARRRFL